MARPYEAYEREEKAKARAAGAEFAAQRRRAAEEEIARTFQQMDLAAAPKKQAYQQQMAEVPESYRPVFSKQAVQQAVTARRITDQLANLGLLRSGIAQELAAGTLRQKQAADRAAYQRQQGDMQRLQQALAAFLSDVEAKKAAKAADIRQKAEKEIETYQQKQFKEAAATALKRYKADQAEELARYKAQAAKKKG